MNVILHEAIRKECEVHARSVVIDASQIVTTVPVVAKDLLLFITSRNHVVKRPVCFEPQRSGRIAS